MPKRTDIKSILIIGAGPIVIGQACEFDYSGAQACKALREEGYRVILVNSNPATIMTDPEMADATYIEPITVEAITKIIEAERPDAILPTMGGQTALNAALALDDAGVLAKYEVELIGAKRAAIGSTVAYQAGVPPSDVTVSITPASVLLTITIASTGTPHGDSIISALQPRLQTVQQAATFLGVPLVTPTTVRRPASAVAVLQ